MSLVAHRCSHGRIVWWSGDWEDGDPTFYPPGEPCPDCEKDGD